MLGRFATLTGLVTTILASSPSELGWKLTRQDEDPKVFAVTSPTSTNLNVGNVALVCEEVDGEKSLQLQLYPTNQEPILPRGSSRKAMKENPRAEIVIDGVVFPIILGFGGDYALLLDREEGGRPILSEPLVDAIEQGHTMVVRFDLLREAPDRQGAFDGELTVDLTAGEGQAAIKAVRQACRP